MSFINKIRPLNRKQSLSNNSKFFNRLSSDWLRKRNTGLRFDQYTEIRCKHEQP